MLRAEGLAVLVVCAAFYARLHLSWWTFGLLFFSPDISFAAYLIDTRVGAAAYNTLHSYIGPLVIGLVAPPLLPYALIWAAHIGFDRAVGYGLKYATAFGDTHLGHK